MEITSKNLVLKGQSNKSNTLIFDTLESISRLMGQGEISRAKNRLMSLVKLCETSGRIPQLFIQLKKFEELEELNQNIDLFLSSGELSHTSNINKVLKLLSKEEIFYFVETGKISWSQTRELLVSMTGRYHDIRALKLFLVSCILKKENTVDSVRIFFRNYPSITKLCFNLLNEKEKGYFSSKELKEVEQVKIIKRRFEFDFDAKDSPAQNKAKKKTVKEINNTIEEVYYLDQFIKASNSYAGCLDALLLNRLYVAADFYYEIVKEKISFDLKDLYFVEIRRGLGRKLEVVNYIKKNKLFNQSDPFLGKHYYEILKAMHEDK